MSLELWSGSGKHAKKHPYTFTSADVFANFAISNPVWVVSKDGTQLDRVVSLRKALAVLARDSGDFLRVTSLDDFRDDMTNLKGHRDNLARGMEQATTRAIAASADMAQKFGALHLVAEGQSVVFRNSSNEDFLEVDGLVANSTAVLLNFVKTTPAKADVRTLLNDAVKLTQVLEGAADYTSEPAAALAQLAHVKDVVPVFCGYNFAPEVARACTEKGVPTFLTNGTDFSLRAIDASRQDLSRQAP